LPARAIENVSYSLGVNRIGNDGNGISYTGHSAVYDFKGSKIFDLAEMEIIKVVKLEADDLDTYRKKFPVWMDSDSFRIL
jgi:predicted amidohydrolase